MKSGSLTVRLYLYVATMFKQSLSAVTLAIHELTATLTSLATYIGDTSTHHWSIPFLIQLFSLGGGLCDVRDISVSYTPDKARCSKEGSLQSLVLLCQFKIDPSISATSSHSYEHKVAQTSQEVFELNL